MILRGLRAGYVPASQDLSAPSDRRRFPYYARRRNLTFEIATPSETYDLVILNQSADLSVWHRYRRGNAKIVYDAIDSYLAIPQWNLKGLLRGLSKFVTRQSRYLQFSYRKAVQKMCQRSDAVICSTEEQKRQILPFCKNVHIILDFQKSEVRTTKTDYSRGDVFNFVWEGLASPNRPVFPLLRKVLEPIWPNHKIALHLVTDLVYGQYHNKYVKRHTVDDIRKVFGDFAKNVYLYQWNSQLFSIIACACDLALIPLPMDDPFYAGKPENKIILFWRLGIPVVVSAIPTYERVMRRCHLPMACRTQVEWQQTLERYMNDEAARREAGQAGKRFAEEHYSEERIMECWDNLLASL